jgi:hypothetical protein
MHEVSNARSTASNNFYIAMDHHHHIHVLNWKQQIQKWVSKEQKQKSNQQMRPLQFTSCNPGPPPIISVPQSKFLRFGSTKAGKLKREREVHREFGQVGLGCVRSVMQLFQSKWRESGVNGIKLAKACGTSHHLHGHKVERDTYS